MLNSGQGLGLERRFGIAVSAILSSRISSEQPVTFSRLKAPAHFQLQDIMLEDAYSIHVNRTPQAKLTIRQGELAQGEQATARHVLPKDGIALYDLSELRMMSMESPFDTVRFFIGRQALREVARDGGHRGEVRLNRPALGFFDPIITHFAGILEACFADPEQATPLFLDHVALALGAHLLQNYATSAVRLTRLNGGLAAWQERWAKEMLDASLNRPISIAEIAGACGLSASHFARAFRRSTGRPPHQWLMERRIEKAKALLVATPQSLSEVAASCGFSDQSHMGRFFLRFVGESPASWRRALARRPDDIAQEPGDENAG